MVRYSKCHFYDMDEKMVSVEGYLDKEFLELFDDYCFTSSKDKIPMFLCLLSESVRLTYSGMGNQKSQKFMKVKFETDCGRESCFGFIDYKFFTEVQIYCEEHSIDRISLYLSLMADFCLFGRC